MTSTTTNLDALAILQAPKNDKLARLAALDLLLESGARLAQYDRRRLESGKASREEVEAMLVGAGLVRVEDTPSHLAGVAFHEALARVQVDRVPVVTRDRHIPRKEQAALARKLLASLGLKAVSVTSPDYSMASTVGVSMPALRTHDRDRWPHNHTACCYQGDGAHREETRCPACSANAAAEAKVCRILAAAFPNHDDRSDYASDYHDSKWSVNG